MNRPTNPQTKSTWQRALFWLLSNGPAVVTVIGSAGVAVASSALQLTEVQILQAVLALLALIGTSLLSERLVEGRGLRDRLNLIHTRLDETLAYVHGIETIGLDRLITRRRDLSPLEDRLQGAMRVSISGGSLFRLANEYKNLFEQLAHAGCTLRFLLTDPDSHAAEHLSSAVVYEANDADTYRAQMRAALLGLTSIAHSYPNECQVKLCTIPPPFGLMVLEGPGDSHLIQVELYLFRLPARERPLLILDRQREPNLHALFASQFEDLWHSRFSRSAKTTSPTP